MYRLGFRGAYGHCSRALAATPGLKTLLALGSGLLISTLVAILGFIIEGPATRQIEMRIGTDLQELAFQVHDRLRRELSERLDDVKLAATSAAFVDPAVSRLTREARLHRLSHDFARYTWIGLVDAGGKVVASTDSALAGSDLTHEVWFREGLQGPYSGSLKASPALAPAATSEPGRFIDLAAPVVRDGRVVGVLGAYLSWAWAEEKRRSLLVSARQRQGTDLMVLDADGVVLLGPPDLLGIPLDVPGVRAARAGKTGYVAESWPDGKTYATGFTSGSRVAQASGLGWLVLARQEAATALEPVADLRRHLLMWGAGTALLFVSLGWLGARWIAAPLRSLTAAADRLQHGGDGEEMPVSTRYAEVASLSSSLATLLAGLRQSQARLRALAMCDPLTCLPNRALLRDRLGQAVAQTHRTKRPAALMILDLDHFKDVNDTLGHLTGDRLLTEAARRLTACVREMDTVARLGGDEFALVICELRHPDDAELVARKAIAELAKPFHLEGQDVHVGASAGIAICPTDGSDPDQLLRHADLALYRAKASGGHACHYFAPAMAAEVAARKGLERGLRQALQSGDLELHFQPELDLHSGCIRSVEALLRWRHKDRTWISPERFIPVAETSGLIGPMGAWALCEACHQAKVWRESGLGAVTVAVNVSLTQCRRGDLASTVEKALQEAGLPPHALELEVTESVFLRDEDDAVLADLHRVRAAGVTVAIDDFGTGYSSLARLRMLPVDKVKLDRSFIARLGREAGAEAIVRAMVALGHGLGLQVTAEGVEEEFQLRFLQSAGCDGAQGFLVGRPVQAHEFTVSSRLLPLAAEAEPARGFPAWQHSDYEHRVVGGAAAAGPDDGHHQGRSSPDTRIRRSYRRG